MVRTFAVGCAILVVLAAAAAAGTHGASPALAQSNALSWVGQVGGAVQAVAAGYDGLVFVGVGPRLLVYAMCPASQPVLVGQSGMGKSTITNALIPGAAAATREISTALDSPGKPSFRR